MKAKNRDGKNRFSAKRVAVTAMFVALAFAVSWIEIPFPWLPFLKLDLGNVFILLVGFLLGPIEGIVTCVVKEGLRALLSGSGGVGEIANCIATSAYILLPATVYRFRKGIKTVVACLATACPIGTVAALLTNRFITFPLFLGAETGAAIFYESFWLIVAFNLVKTALVGALTLLLYKRLSNFLKKFKI